MVEVYWNDRFEVAKKRHAPSLILNDWLGIYKGRCVSYTVYDGIRDAPYKIVFESEEDLVFFKLKFGI